MIRTMCIYYNNKDVVFGRQISEFFKFAGLYVTERFYKQDDKLKKKIIEKFDKFPFVEYRYDIYVYIISNIVDEKYFIDRSNNYSKCCLVGYRDYIINDYPDYGVISNKNYSKTLECLKGIIESLADENIIDFNEKNELLILARNYINNGIYELLSKTKYSYPFINNHDISNKIQKYNGIINGLLHVLSEQNIKLGDSGYRIIQQSILRLATEANIYAIRTNTNGIYDVDDLLQKCDMVISDDSYSNAFVLLKGELNSYLLDHNNEAYSCYMKLCNTEEKYNAYAYYLKGKYWTEFGFDSDAARKYFLKSVYISPWYYNAWYMLGCNYIENNKLNNALAAFSMVCIIISQSRDNGVMCAEEYYYYFQSRVKIANIFGDNNMKDVALKYYLSAEDIWNKISSLEGEEIDNIIKSQLGINGVYDKIASIYYGAGLSGLGDDYLLRKAKRTNA